LAKTQIISSLINAAKNGKKVTVQIELQAFWRSFKYLCWINASGGH
jgi:polyphosphate kinase